MSAENLPVFLKNQLSDLPAEYLFVIVFTGFISRQNFYADIGKIGSCFTINRSNAIEHLLKKR